LVCLLPVLFITSTLAIASDNKNIQSHGTISYYSPDARLMGVDHFWWGEINTALVDLVKNSGGNAWREHMIITEWEDNPSWWKDPSVTFRSRMRELMQWTSARGIKVIIATIGWDSWGGNQQQQADTIMNESGMADQWIAAWGEIIADLKPYAIDVMNEPMWVYGTTYEATTTQEQFFEVYRSFVTKAIRAWRTIKPDLVCVVHSCPFWDLKPIAANPIPEPNIVYPIHYYYAYDGTLGPTPIASAFAYWDGRLAEAKILLEEYMLNDAGLKAAQDAGLQVLMEEVGTCLAAPNAFVFMQDMYDLCKAHNIGVTHHTLNPYPKCAAGLLNEDWLTLNDLGEIWYRNMQG
jgi:hypothetical protein